MPGKRKRAKAATNGWKRRRLSNSRSPPNRPKTLRNWSDESMRQAIEAVRSGEMGANRAARAFDVPASTLKDRVSGRVKHGTNPGPVPYLSSDEENELATFLIECSKIGYGKTKREVLVIVQKTLEKKGRDVNFNGEGWWTNFMRRNPQLSLRSTDPLSRVRANALTEENMRHYFSLLEKTLTDNDLLNKPSRIYNMDETGMPLDHKQLKRIALKGMKKVHGPASGDKTQITVVACASAAGHALPPMVIFKGERFNHEWSVGEVPDTLYGMSENGWIDQELFFYWLKRLFIQQIPPQRPVILLCDGHSSHYTPEAISGAAEVGVIIFCIPPNTTHAAQPLDVSFFGPLKRHWSSVCHEFLANNPGSVVTKMQFSQLFSQAWMKAIKPENIVSGFKKTGICPLDSGAITSMLPSPSNESESSLDEKGSSQSTDETEPSETLTLTAESQSTQAPMDEPDLLPPQFSPKQIELFETRYENGYDLLFDQDYVTWLRFHHPEALPQSLDQDIDPSLALPPSTDADTDSSALPPSIDPDTDPSLTSDISIDTHTCDHSTQDENKENVPAAANSNGATPQSARDKSLPSTSKSLSETRKVFSYVTEFLTFPEAAPKPSKSTKKTPGGARVLTSEESLALMKEKEMKKKKEEEAKEMRKKEREAKRLEKEEEKKRKAEERERKKIERERKMVEIQEKRRQREMKMKEKATQKSTRSGDREPSSEHDNGPQNRESGNNECTICFGCYEDDFSPGGTLLRSWVQCTNAECGKWMHEDCVSRDEDVMVCMCGTAFQ